MGAGAGGEWGGGPAGCHGHRTPAAHGAMGEDGFGDGLLRLCPGTAAGY